MYIFYKPHCCTFPNTFTDGFYVQFSSAQSLSRVWLFVTPWITACQASLSITISWSSLRLTSIESVMPFSHLILCRPLFLQPPIPLSIRVFSSSRIFSWGGQHTGVSALASFLPKKSQGWSPSEWLVGSPCSPRDSQESSPTPQFKSIILRCSEIKLKKHEKLLYVYDQLGDAKPDFLKEPSLFIWVIFCLQGKIYHFQL